MSEFKDIKQYKAFLQNMTESYFGDREKISKREFFSIFQDQVSKFSSRGLKNLDNIFAYDGDATSVTKEEMMTAYSLMDLNLSNKKPDGELNAEASVLNQYVGEEFEQIKDTVFNAYKPIVEPVVIEEQQDLLPSPNLILNDSAKVYFNKPESVTQFNPKDFTLEALKERFKEPEYKVIQEKSFTTGLPPAIVIKKDNKNIAIIMDDCAGKIDVTTLNYDVYNFFKVKK